jgi:transcriptional regulator with XRE-family HTH domain
MLMPAPDEDHQRTPPIPLCQRRLASELRRLRETTGLTRKQVSEHLFCHISKVSRIETGSFTPNQRDVRDLLELYGVEGQVQDDLLRLAREARAKESWWEAYDDVPDVRKYVSLENAAHSIRAYESHVLPGLVQVEPYARRILNSVFPSMRQDKVERLVELRMRRRTSLGPEGPVRLRLVVDEAALRRIPANPETLRPQVNRLIEAAGMEKVSFRIVPFAAGPHPGIAGPFTILEFAAAADLDIVHLEHLTGNAYLDQPEQVEEYKAKFADLERLSWSPDESIAALLDLRQAAGPG